jgi:hypothetical protein
VAYQVLEAELRAVLAHNDGYASAAKPQIDWDDPAAREQLVDARAKDARACLAALDGCQLDPEVAEAAALLATVVGQDLEQGDDGVFRIARKVAADRIISTVDPQARHGHKTAARGFDGYKGHVAVDPDSEIITATRATPGNAGDAGVAADLIADLLAEQPADRDDPAGQTGETSAPARQPDQGADETQPPKVYGDCAYGTGEFQSTLAGSHIDSGCKTQPPSAAGGRLAKDRFDVSLDRDTVTCPAGHTVAIRRGAGGGGIACFGEVCAACPLRDRCTGAAGGRTIRVGPHEDALARARQRQADPRWRADYRATRPKVERKLGHLMRRKHGGRRARVRGTARIDADFRLLAAAANLARLAVLGLRFTTRWAATAP